MSSSPPIFFSFCRAFLSAFRSLGVDVGAGDGCLTSEALTAAESLGFGRSDAFFFFFFD